MQKKITYICITLFVTILAMGRFCSAGQKVTITGMAGNPQVDFAVGDIKQALQKSGYEFVDREAVIRDKDFQGITPMELADNLDRLAQQILAGVTTLRYQSRTGKELAATLTDMESMAYLGRYYADKIRGATDLAVFRADKNRQEHRRRAVNHLTNAVEEWEAYARIATSQYKPQLFSRSHYMDWGQILEEVKKEVELAK